MVKPSIVVFDLGKVLVDFDYSIASRRIAAQSNMSPAEVQTFLDHSPLLYRYETGLMTRLDFFQEIKRATGFRGELEEFGTFFADIFTEMPAMTQLHAELRARNVPTGRQRASLGDRRQPAESDIDLRNLVPSIG